MVDGIKNTDKLVFNLEMYQMDYNEAKLKALRQEIADKYNVPLKNVEVNFKAITVTQNGERLSLTSDIISNIQDPKFQQKLFSEYFKMREMEDVDYDEIVAIDNNINSYIDFNAYSKYKSYKYKYVKWSNYRSYGKDNYFDFTKLHGLVLLNGEPSNQAGKTTFASDLLRFALFGKASKDLNLNGLFNRWLTEETEVVVEAGIEIEGCDYVIKRTVTRPKKRTARSSAKQKVEYYKKINDELELIENCEGESTSDTNNIIRESVGTIEDFNLVISATAYTLGQLLRMGQTDRGKLFSRWLGLMSIEEKEQVAKAKWKELSKTLLSNKYDKKTLENEVNDMNAVITANEKEIAVDNTKLEVSQKKIDDYNKERTDILVNKKEIRGELINTDVATLEYSIKSLTEQLEQNRAKLGEMKKEYEILKNASFDLDKYNQKRQESIDIQKQNAEIKVNIGHLNADNQRINKLIEQKICPTCGHKIDNAEQSASIELNNNKIKDFISQGIANKEKLDDLTKEIAEMEIQRTNAEKLTNLKLRMTAVKTQIDNFKLQLTSLEKTKEEIETNKENIKYNNEIDNKIRLVDINIKTETEIKENLIREIQGYKSQNEQYNKEITNRNTVIKKLTEEEKVIKNWTIYQELVGRNGIVKIVLRQALPIINNEISRLLQDLCDFKVEISVTDDSKVSMNFIRKGVEFDLCSESSGLEGTMACLALRAALSSLGNMPKVNMLVLDEIIGPVASCNFDKLKELFRRITTNYDFILHICHESTAEDWHDQIVVITKDENEISHIVLK